MVKVYMADVTVLKNGDAGALLVYALQKEKVRDFSIMVHSNGKPYLSGEEKLYFNLSHSENMVMCATARQEVGCDVERRTAFDYSLASFVMMDKELELIYRHSDPKEQQETFFRLWTLKESYMKATGLGIRLEPGIFGMSVEKDAIHVEPPVDERKFNFKEYFMGDEYCFSCCSLEDEFCGTMTEIDLREI